MDITELLDAQSRHFIDSTAARADLPIDVVALLRSLGATLEVRDASHQTPAAEWILAKGRNVVVIYRQPDAPQWLSARERYSVAHEVAHILVARSTNWRPSSKREHFELEEACQAIAAEILIPRRVVTERADDAGPQGLIAVVNRLRILCAVSFEAAARRTLDGSTRTALAAATPAANRRDEPVLRVLWATGAKRAFSLERGSHIKGESPWMQLFNRRSPQESMYRSAFGGVEWAVVTSPRTVRRVLVWAQLAGESDLEASHSQSGELTSDPTPAVRQLDFYP